ncbi:MAG: site-specific integrase [Hyphomicrobiaceae bacterium]
MPRRPKAPRLYLRKRHNQQWWVVLDRGREHSTGCSAEDVGGAEKWLADYLASKHEPARRLDSLHQIPIADVLNVYLREHAPTTRNPSFIAATADPVLTWWGSKTLADIRGQTCRDYVAWRTSQTIRNRKVARKVSDQTARHDLKTLRAAINYFHVQYGPLPSVPAVSLPDRAAPRERWLTRSEAARFLWAARRDPHVARFLILGLHTASRHGAILGLRWLPSTAGGWVDLERGVLHRRAVGARDSKKRQPPARISDRLLAHLRRWHRLDRARGATHVVHYHGQRMEKMRRAWARCREAAGLGEDVTPHILRHTAITWELQAGAPPWEVSGWAGISIEMLERVYGHHAPDFQRNIGRRRR